MDNDGLGTWLAMIEAEARYAAADFGPETITAAIARLMEVAADVSATVTEPCAAGLPAPVLHTGQRYAA